MSGGHSCCPRHSPLEFGAERNEKGKALVTFNGALLCLGNSGAGTVDLIMEKNGERFIEAEISGNKVSGAGQPSAIIKEVDGVNYIYAYYTDWGIGPDSIHLARAPLGQIDNPNAWQKHNNGEFSSTGSKGLSTPVIIPQPDEVYVAIPSVSFNNHIGKFIATFEGSSGFWLSTSVDGISWQGHQKIVEFPQAHDKVVSGSSRFSYPTLLSLNTNNQFVTGNTGELIYSRGVYDKSPNQMKVREFNIS